MKNNQFGANKYICYKLNTIFNIRWETIPIVWQRKTGGFILKLTYFSIQQNSDMTDAYITDFRYIGHNIWSGYSKTIVISSFILDIEWKFRSKMIPFEFCFIRKGKKVGGNRYEARSRGRSSPDTLAFWACETPRRQSRLLSGQLKHD